MSRKKTTPKKPPAEVSGPPSVGRKGPPTNLRAGGPMADRRQRRRRTRGAEEQAALED